MTTDHTTEHLKAELARIDILLRRAITRWQSAGQDETDAFRGLYISDAEVNALQLMTLGASWGSVATTAQEQDATYRRDLALAIKNVARIEVAAADSGQVPRLARLISDFSLSELERDALLLALAGSLDLRYERIFGYLQDDVTRKRPTPNLVLDIMLEPSADRLACLPAFLPGGPLVSKQLISLHPQPASAQSSLLSRAMEIDETVIAWLLGRYEPSGSLTGHAKLFLEPRNATLFRDSSDWTVHADRRASPLLAFQGPDTARHLLEAESLASQAARPLLEVDFRRAMENGNPARDIVLRAIRDALLTGALLLVLGWDAALENGEPDSGILSLLVDLDFPTVLSSTATWLPVGANRSNRIFPIVFDVLPYPDRRAVWKTLAGDMVIDTDDLDHLAGQFQLTFGQMRDSLHSAKDLAALEGRTISGADVFAAARAHSNPRLSSLARKIEARYSWDDIVLPDDQIALLHELLDTIVRRPKVLDEWGIGRKLASSRGVTVLFAGPPGTGKTMAAEILSAELKLDLFKIDLSSVVSKYIGETEKNLERIFSEAASSNAILFFDEADALFGKRSEVRDSHDRYANIEISYLLQRMEAYDGVTILATNLRANLDEAFTRRLQFSVEFPFPDAQDRLKIWKALFPPDLPHDPGLDFERLADRFRLAGGSIRNIIVSAAYLAAADGGRVTMTQLLHGTRRELQKMGRLVDEAQLSTD